MDIDNNIVEVPANVKQTSKSANTNNKKQHGKHITPYLTALLHSSTDSDFLKCHLSLPNQDQIIASNVQGLLDNGALGIANYISIEMAAKLLAAGGTKKSVASKLVQSAFTAIHGISKGTINFDVILHPENDTTPIRFPIDAHIIALLI